jgi:hypothetical protein
VLVAAAACSALLATGMPSAGAAPDADDQGFADSTARCGEPDTAVAFGRTGDSRVAICENPDGAFEYRGVRVRDGAKLIAPASHSGGVVYVAEHDGITYTVTASSLVISADGEVIRRESMIEFHQPGKPEAPEDTAAPGAPESTGAPEATVTPQTPLPPPLPAEVGG